MEFEVLKRGHIKRNIIIGVVAVLLISAVILNFTRAKYRTTADIPIASGTINYSLADLNIVGLYIDGEEATELDSSKNYTLDTSRSTCTYKDGSTIDNLTLNYDSETRSFSISPYTTKGTKCTLYFDEKKSASDVIEDLYPDSENMLIYDEYKNLRYIGADPNNYVYFNCDNYENPSSSTCELWRIIGVFNDDSHGINETRLVKIIRNENIGRYSWDYDSSGSYDNNWSSSTLQILLNSGPYYNATTGIYYNNSTIATTVDFTTTGLKDDVTKNMIETVTWKLGGVTMDIKALVTDYYESERSSAVYNGNPIAWTGKIALMYPSDYGYATSGGTTVDRETCLTSKIYNWGYSYRDCVNNDWLFTGSRQWLLMPNKNYSIFASVVESNGGVVSDAYDLNAEYYVRPTVYLTSSVSITDGDGSASNPYTLKP